MVGVPEAVDESSFRAGDFAKILAHAAFTAAGGDLGGPEHDPAEDAVRVDGRELLRGDVEQVVDVVGVRVRQGAGRRRDLHLDLLVVVAEERLGGAVHGVGEEGQEDGGRQLEPEHRVELLGRGLGGRGLGMHRIASMPGRTRSCRRGSICCCPIFITHIRHPPWVTCYTARLEVVSLRIPLIHSLPFGFTKLSINLINSLVKPERL